LRNIILNKSIIALTLVLILSACEKKEEALILPTSKGDVKNYTVRLGRDYTTQLFFTLRDGAIKANDFMAWDLGFDCNPNGYLVKINGGKEVQVANTGTKDFSEIPSLAGVEWEYDNPAGEWKGTAFGDWYDSLSRKCHGYVYLIDRGQTANPRYKKLKFLTVNPSGYTFLFANLDGSDAHEYAVPKIANRNYSYINFDDPNKIIDLEPDRENWDILFTRYRHVYYNMTPITPYSVTGVILNPNKVICAKDSTIGFENITAETLKEFEFTNRKDVIGFDWKRYDFELNRYDVVRKYTYIIKDTKGFYYKLRFIDFYDEQGVKGAPKFETQRL
jgi:hypothetical protein